MRLPDTKYDIGNVVRPRFSTSGQLKYVVQEIETISCSAGTQTMYNCRPYGRPLQSFGWEEAIGNADNNRLYKGRFREDEIVPWDGD